MSSEMIDSDCNSNATDCAYRCLGTSYSKGDALYRLPPPSSGNDISLSRCMSQVGDGRHPEKGGKPTCLVLCHIFQGRY